MCVCVCVCLGGGMCMGWGHGGSEANEHGSRLQQVNCSPAVLWHAAAPLANVLPRSAA
jgi:hypothetical protein